MSRNPRTIWFAQISDMSYFNHIFYSHPAVCRQFFRWENVLHILGQEWQRVKCKDKYGTVRRKILNVNILYKFTVE